MIHLSKTDAQVEKSLPAATAARDAWVARGAAINDDAWKADSLKGLPNIWSEIKPKLMAAQNDKCVYCERKLASGPHALLECDVEHFRPKSSCREWQPTAATQASYGKVRTGRANGYAWLAHQVPNLMVSCKTCNSPLKSDRFPIGGKTQKARQVSTLDQKEKPLLIHPRHENPEAFIGWHGLDAQVVGKTPAAKKRAAVTIDFFLLSSRDDVRQARARQLVNFDRALRAGDLPADLARDFTGDSAECAAAMRAFHVVWRRDKKKAAQLVKEAGEYLNSFVSHAGV